MAKALKVIATPIGNMRDITLRAIDELKAADLIFAEDTRHSGRLLKALGIELKNGARMLSCFSGREERRAVLAIDALNKNQSVALISDAGCPGINDPGSLFVQAVLEQGLSVEVIPGPSALSASIMGAGIDLTRFAFLGFLPRRKSQRQRLIEEAKNGSLGMVIFESPFRVAALLDELSILLGPRRVVVARELTKIHESFHRGSLGSPLLPPLVTKGECVVLIEATTCRRRPLDPEK
jgi:16S rRNA (cytidine1402-2'-O)-methyltransferase